MKNNIKYTNEFVKEYILKFGCILLSEYVNTKEKLSIQCVCGEIYHTTFDKFKNKNKIRCNNCSNKIMSEKSKLTFDYVKNKIEEMGITLLQDYYIDTHSLLKLKCKCGDIFYKSFNNIKKQPQCPKCGENNRIEKFTKLKYILNDEELTLLMNNKGFSIIYIERFEKLEDLKVYCKDKENYMYRFSYSQIYNNNFKRIKYNKKNIFCLYNMKNYLIINNKQDYKIIKYTNFKNVTLEYIGENINFKEYGQFKTKLNFATHPLDYFSYMENKTRNFLINNNIKFKEQYTFDDLIFIKKLKIDFMILDIDNNPIIGIELQGRQHYEPVDYFGGKDIFNIQKIKDNLKREYFKLKGIDFLEIPYDKFNDYDFTKLKKQGDGKNFTDNITSDKLSTGRSSYNCIRAE